MKAPQVRLLFYVLTLGLVSASVVSEKKDVKESDGHSLGQIKYHYDASASRACSYLLLVGVGTSMKVDDYDNITGRIAQGKSIVVAISDHQVGSLVKNSASKYAQLANRLHDQLELYIPVCNTSTVKIILGGHSASGQAALAAVQQGLFAFQLAGFVGLDPYKITNRTMYDTLLPASLSTLYWGFTKTTCFVRKDDAALGAYRFSSSNAGRVLYAIDNSDNRIAHCVFTDNGCGTSVVKVCSTRNIFGWVYDSVAESIHLFIKALNENTAFTKEKFELTGTNSPVFLYVNEDVENNLLENGAAAKVYVPC